MQSVFRPQYSRWCRLRHLAIIQRTNRNRSSGFFSLDFHSTPHAISMIALNKPFRHRSNKTPCIAWRMPRLRALRAQFSHHNYTCDGEADLTTNQIYHNNHNAAVTTQRRRRGGAILVNDIVPPCSPAIRQAVSRLIGPDLRVMYSRSWQRHGRTAALLCARSDRLIADYGGSKERGYRGSLPSLCCRLRMPRRSLHRLLARRRTPTTTTTTTHYGVRKLNKQSECRLPANRLLSRA